MKTVLLSDVHGCLREMKLLLSRVGFSETEDTLIFLGDMMDRGFRSYDTFRYFVALKETMGERCILCRGNHDHNVLFPPQSRIKNLKWFFSGRVLSDIDFFLHGERLSSTAPFLEKNTVLYYEEPRFFCVHAALVSERMEENSLETLLYDHRETRRNRYQGKLAVTGHIHELHPHYYAGDGGKGVRIPYGKTLELPKTGIISIDTGCAELNRLTVMVVEGNHYCLESIHRGGF